MSELAVIDWIFISLTLLMVIHGFVKGFIEELFSWAALVLAIWVSVLLFPAGGAYIRTMTMENVRVVPELLAFIAIFIIVVAVVKIVERIFRNVIQGANLGAVNKFFGALFGIAEGLALTALAIFVLRFQPLFDPSALIDESLFAQFLSPFIDFLLNQIPLNRGQEIVDTAFFVLPGLWV